MAVESSLNGWSKPDRAPGLRRLADRLEHTADSHRFPDRVRRIARELRVRATLLEIGPDVDAIEELRDADRPDETTRFAAEVEHGFDVS